MSLKWLHFTGANENDHGQPQAKDNYEVEGQDHIAEYQATRVDG